MHQRSRISRVRLLQQANDQLLKLNKLKQDLLYINNSSSQKASLQQEIFKQSSKTVSLYNELIRLYSLPSYQSISHRQQADFSYRSNHRSHSRTHAKTDLPKDHLPTELNSVLMTSTLSCTLSYIYTNFENRLEDAAGILIKGRGEIQEYMDQMQMEKSSTSFQLMKSYIRISVNLVVNLILQRKYTYAVEVFNEMVKLIDSIGEREVGKKCLEFVGLVWFGEQNCILERGHYISENSKWFDSLLGKGKTLSVQQAISVTHLIFNIDLLTSKNSQSENSYPQNFTILLQKSLQAFFSHQMYEYAFFTLRRLLQSPIQTKQKKHYEYVLNELIINEKISQNLQVENIESIACFRCMIESLVELAEKNGFRYEKDQMKVSKQKEQQYHLFILIIKVKKNKILVDQSIGQRQKSFILNSFNQMLGESDNNIIENLLQQQFCRKILSEINTHCQIINNFCKKFIHQAFNHIKSACNVSQQRSNRIALSERRINSNTLPEQSSFYQDKSNLKNVSISPSRSRRYLKLISTSINSELNQTNPQISQRHRIFSQSNTKSQLKSDQKRLNKMVRLCEYGAFLNKRNFNSDGGEFKFIKITSTHIKWSKNAEKIDQQSQSYPLKDIQGVLYGKITPTFKKSCNKTLKEQNCFSLVLQKRTMDFYCKDQNQVQTWVCGLTQILKKQGHQIAGYTPGKMKWRKMFAILREAFIQPLKLHERNQYYFQNAYSLISFRENGYKLPVRK